MTTTHTRRTLLEQTLESRERNIFFEILRQLDMQFGIDERGLDLRDPLINLKPDNDPARFLLDGPDADRFALILARVFPFLTSPRSLLEKLAAQGEQPGEKPATLGDLVRLILDKVGA